MSDQNLNPDTLLDDAEKEKVTWEQVERMVMKYVRNYFNEANCSKKPPEDSEDYQLFQEVCKEIVAFRNTPMGSHSVYLQESVFGSYTKIRATTEDGVPINWKAAFRDDLAPFRTMFST